MALGNFQTFLYNSALSQTNSNPQNAISSNATAVFNAGDETDGSTSGPAASTGFGVIPSSADGASGFVSWSSEWTSAAQQTADRLLRVLTWPAKNGTGNVTASRSDWYLSSTAAMNIGRQPVASDDTADPVTWNVSTALNALPVKTNVSLVASTVAEVFSERIPVPSDSFYRPEVNTTLYYYYDITDDASANATSDKYNYDGTTAVRGLVMLRHSSVVYTFITCLLLGLIILATVVGNIFVIAAVVLERNLHSVANYLIASLAVADLMVAALVMPLAAVNEVSTRWFLGREACDAFISFDVLCCTASILHLVAISMDRYWAVTRADYIHNRPARRIFIMIGLSWAISTVISIPPLFGWKSPDSDPDSTGVCIISQVNEKLTLSQLSTMRAELSLQR